MRDPQTRFSELLLNVATGFLDAQEKEHFWAIEEGFRRSDLNIFYGHNLIPTANKEHKCARGCQIEERDKYFNLGDRSSPLKICASCMAMVLYFKNVHELPPYQYDYWDREKERPHRAKK